MYKIPIELLERIFKVIKELKFEAEIAEKLSDLDPEEFKILLDEAKLLLEIIEENYLNHGDVG